MFPYYMTFIIQFKCNRMFLWISGIVFFFFDTEDRISLIKEQGKPHSVLHFRGPLLTYKEVTSRKPLRPHHVG